MLCLKFLFIYTYLYVFPFIVLLYVVNCVLKIPNVVPGKIGVHENVCAKMREKLVSEVKVNIQKLKAGSLRIKRHFD